MKGSGDEDTDVFDDSILLTIDDMNLSELKEGKEHSKHVLFHQQHLWRPREWQEQDIYKGEQTPVYPE